MPLEPLKAPDSPVERIRGVLRCTVAFSFLLPTLFGFNLLQMSWLLIKPFSPKTFRALNRWGANVWWGWCDRWVEYNHKIHVEITGDDVPKAENAIVLPNHQEMSDIPTIFRFARKKDRLGDLKWFVKDILKYVPGVGWGMVFLDCLFIKRDWTSDKDKIKAVFQNVITNNVPLWIITFPEGTRVKPHKIEASQKYAEKRNLPKLKHVLLPRTKGFVATCEGLRGHVEAVYDLTIGYTKGVPTIIQFAKGYTRLIHLHVRRFKLDDLPTDPVALSEWLVNLFEQKDQLLDDFYKNGSFPASN